ncbi:MAG: AAA family ATPase [Burkholderiales bacterium]|nr:AAA family ATPase [Burkholderiales bacterium]
MFIIFGGLPGTGKSTIASQVADRLGATWLRIDSIEQAIRSSDVLSAGDDVGTAGYFVAYRIAADNLRAGRIVVADSVNPLGVTRQAYREVAHKAGVGYLEVELVCSDEALHRERVEARRPIVKGFTLPTWEQVVSRRYEAWDQPHLRIDTAVASIDTATQRIVDAASAVRMNRTCPDQ